MPRVAQEVIITSTSLKIDGEEFPWYVSQGGITVNKDRDVTTITFTMPCESAVINVPGYKEERDCDLCGEREGKEMGEFIIKGGGYVPNDTRVYAHAQCAAEQGFEIA